MPEATCADCRAPISSRARRCRSCKRKAEKLRRAERERRPCEQCGTEFAPASQRSRLNPQRFCSIECANAAHSETMAEWSRRTGNVPPGFTRRSRARAKLTRAARGTTGSSVITTGPCACCGATVAARRAPGQFGWTCSRQCWERRKVEHRAAMREAKRRAIFRRDMWTCQLCMKPLDPALPPGHRLEATVDHIWPVSLGGGDEDSNLQAAHRSCNSKKGNKVDRAAA